MSENGMPGIKSSVSASFTDGRRLLGKPAEADTTAPPAFDAETQQVIRELEELLVGVKAAPKMRTWRFEWRGYSVSFSWGRRR